MNSPGHLLEQPRKLHTDFNDRRPRWQCACFGGRLPGAPALLVGGSCLGTLLPSALVGLQTPSAPARRALLSLLLTHQAEVSELN